MPFGPLVVTGLLAALDWGAWDWAASANESTVGLIAGLLMAPIAVAFAWSFVRVMIAVARLALARAVAGSALQVLEPNGGSHPAPFDIEAQEDRLAA